MAGCSKRIAGEAECAELRIRQERRNILDRYNNYTCLHFAVQSHCVSKEKRFSPYHNKIHVV